MSEKLCIHKSLPELRISGVNKADNVFIVNEIKNEKLKSFERCLLEVFGDSDKLDLHRSHSLGYNSRKVKTNLNVEKSTIELKELSIENQQQLEEDLDSGLCSANEDTENHKKISGSPTSENNQASNFQSELKLKTKEIREKIRRRDLSRLNTNKSVTFKHSRNAIHGYSALDGGYFWKRRNKISYNSELNNLRSFKNTLNSRHLTKTKFDFCSEIKEEETNNTAELDEALKPESSESNTKTLMNSIESVFHKKQGHHNNSNAAVAVATAAAAATSEAINDKTLQKLIDIVIPPLIVSSNFDLTSSDNVAELSLIMHQHLNEASSGVKLDFNSLTSKQPDSEANNEIMRTCLGYLDHINKKHTKERQRQAIRNKISGVVLLALVFFVVFGLGIVMSIYLVKSLTHVIKQNN